MQPLSHIRRNTPQKSPNKTAAAEVATVIDISTVFAGELLSPTLTEVFPTEAP